MYSISYVLTIIQINVYISSGTALNSIRKRNQEPVKMTGLDRFAHQPELNTLPFRVCPWIHPRVNLATGTRLFAGVAPAWGCTIYKVGIKSKPSTVDCCPE
ncbi:hypothetical protein HZ326_3690 [Fusarium oxysporum f. sp. albedinis]|nr:hypothetical protein HZ326_3690 [Fusarium oxysporum f. sp. albedinis]